MQICTVRGDDLREPRVENGMAYNLTNRNPVILFSRENLDFYCYSKHIKIYKGKARHGFLGVCGINFIIHVYRRTNTFYYY